MDLFTHIPKFAWIIITLIVLLFIVLPGWMYVVGDQQERQAAVKITSGFWIAATGVVAFQLFMNFIIKPIIGYLS